MEIGSTASDVSYPLGMWGSWSGYDYPTEDGTRIRDYVHVIDLADGHLKAFNRIIKSFGVST